MFILFPSLTFQINFLSMDCIHILIGPLIGRIVNYNAVQFSATLLLCPTISLLLTWIRGNYFGTRRILLLMSWSMGGLGMIWGVGRLGSRERWIWWWQDQQNPNPFLVLIRFCGSTHTCARDIAGPGPNWSTAATGAYPGAKEEKCKCKGGYNNTTV